ncbi:MAG: methyltransferase domain-containing protein [Alphaproteobacteria bacterium]|nr:methyltransferase domain-containing protein [Alphaproteobacteria bacterium]
MKNKMDGAPNSASETRILSAGCASGQEAVSVALLFHEMNFPKEKSLNLYALDMSRKIIERAQKALYTHYEVQKGLPIRLLLKYFTPVKNDYWQLNPEVSKDIHYRVYNLMNLFDQTDFDIVLCRNMLSFMTPEAQMLALQNLSSIMKPDGLLIIGASEVLFDNTYFEKIPDKIACYKKKGEPEAKSQKTTKKIGGLLTKKPRFKSAVSGKNN